jgi:HSP20 family protein
LNSPEHARDAAFHGTRGVFPPVNLHQSEDGYVLTAELPGVGSENIDVQIEGSTITLSGQRKPGGAAGEGVSVHRRERQFGTFRRAFELPSDVDTDRAKATHKNGVLTLALPKLAVAKPRQIEIETR